jgi:hypothetical protein
MGEYYIIYIYTYQHHAAVFRPTGKQARVMRRVREPHLNQFLSQLKLPHAASLLGAVQGLYEFQYFAIILRITLRGLYVDVTIYICLSKGASYVKVFEFQALPCSQSQ